MGYSLWAHTELDTTEETEHTPHIFHIYIYIYIYIYMYMCVYIYMYMK